MEAHYILNTDVSFYVKKLDNHIQRIIYSLYDRKAFQECSLMNMWVVDFLYHQEKKGQDVFQKDVEAEFYINRATASKMLSLMEEKRLILRKSSDKDARLKKIVLLERGYELQRLCRTIREEVERRITRNMSEEEVGHFKALCSRMMGNLN